MTWKNIKINLSSVIKFKLFAWFVFIGLAISAALFYLPIGRASLVVNFNSSVPSTSEVFYSIGGEPYSAENSRSSAVVKRINKVHFELSKSVSSLRWDPLSTGSRIEIDDMYISVYGVKFGLDINSLKPLYQIEKIENIDGKTVVVMSEGGNDPQLSVLADFHKINLTRILCSILIGFLLAAIGLMTFHLRKQIPEFWDWSEKTLSDLPERFRNSGFSFKEIGILSAIGAVLYIYFLSTYSISIDDEYSALRTDPDVWVSQGRWFVYFVEKFIFPQPSIPFAPFAFLIISLSASYSLILRAHDFPSNWKTYLSYPIFCAFPTWWFISEFYSNIPALAIGVFFVSLSVFLIFRQENRDVISARNSGLVYALVVVLLACATSAYQSLLLMFLCMVFGVTMLRTLKSDDPAYPIFKRATTSILKVVPLTVLALFLYSLINIITQKLISKSSGYIDQFFHLDSILQHPFGVISAVTNEMATIYSGSSDRYGASIPASTLFMVAATLSIITANRYKAPLSAFLWLGVLASPFAFHFVAGGAALPMRTMISLGYVGWLASMILLYNSRLVFIAAGVSVIAVFQLQFVSVTSQYIASSTITQAHDRALAADIYRRIGELSTDFDRTSQINIDVYGSKEVTTVYANGWSSTMQGSFFAWDGGNLLRMVSYFKVMGYGDIDMLSHSDRVAMTPIFNEMPVWPAAGSVKKIGNTYLVRLSKAPDLVHAEISEAQLK